FLFVTKLDSRSISTKWRDAPAFIGRKLSIFTAVLSTACIALALRRAFLFSAVCRVNSLPRVDRLRARRSPPARSPSVEHKLEFIRSNHRAAGMSLAAHRCVCSIRQKIRLRFCAPVIASVFAPSLAKSLTALPNEDRHL